jgi:hypothetical protein
MTQHNQSRGWQEITSETNKPKPREEVDKLKAVWAADPCWDIEDTEGFEAHREELIAFRQEVESRIQQEWIRKLETKAIELGVPDNLKLAEYVINLEFRLEDINEKLFPKAFDRM